MNEVEQQVKQLLMVSRTLGEKSTELGNMAWR